MLKRLLPLLIITPVLISGIMVLNVQSAHAYSNYNDCVQGESIDFAPNGNLSDADLTAIQTACRREFPTRTNTTNRPSSPRAAVSAQPSQSSRTTTSVNPSAPPSPSASSSAANSSSAAPSVSSAPQSSTNPNPNSNPSDAQTRPYGGFINDSRGIPILDPQQYSAAYQGTSFSRLTSTRDAFGFLTAFALSFIGMVAIIFLIYAGFIYITANGEQSKIDKAKKLIWGTVIGILIVFSVYAIIATLLNMSAAINPGLNVGPLNVGPGGTTLRLP